MSQAERNRRYSQTENGKRVRREISSRWAKDNREKVNAAIRLRYQRQRELATAIKTESGCIDCGYDADARALDFDHRDPRLKKFSVAKRYGNVSDDTLLSEIAKCDVRCANCHRTKEKT